MRTPNLVVLSFHEIFWFFSFAQKWWNQMKGLYITCIVDECHNDGIDDLILSSTTNIMLQDLIQIGSLFSRFSHDCRIRWPVVTTPNQNKVTFLGNCYLQSKVRVAAVSTRQVTQESSLAWSIKREICVDYAPLSQATRVERCTQNKKNYIPVLMK